ncbi:MAG TPA: ATP-binding protein [Candidatus Saccharimonadales bacterium]|nr:ATP-binding protein [Candidatus Saccharimonadales bacterium]
MNLIDVFILVAASLANIGIGLVLLLKNPSSAMNRAFAMLITALIGLSTANFLSTVVSAPNSEFIAVESILLFVVLQHTFFVLFANRFPDNRPNLSNKLIHRYIFFSLIVFLAGIFPGYFTSYTEENASIVLNPSPLIGLFMLHTITSIMIGIRILLYKHKHSRGLTRDQFRFVISASGILLFIAPISNFLLPALLNIKVFVPFAPIYPLAFSTLIAYAIVKHHLFDIKRAVARSVAYILSLGSIGLIYGGAIFLLSSVFISDNKIDSAERASYIILALISALLYVPTKKFFDKLTNRIFYRDAYDPEEFLDELNSAIVGNIELGVLLRHTTKVIQENLKSEHCFIEVLSTPTTPHKIIGVGFIDLDKTETEYILDSLSHSSKRVLITDQLGSGDSKLKNLLSSKNIGVISRLIPSEDQPTEPIAHLIIGTKKSGNVYSKQDVHTIDIISDELLIAIENALRFEEIQGFAAKLQAEVNTATAKLQRTNKKLRELDETKDEFISMASHQLRTPLTSVKGYMSMVLEGDAGKISKQQRELLNQAFVSSQRMVYLIADLLNVSRLKTGKFIIEATPTNLAEVIEGEIGQLRETAKAKKVEIEYEKPKNFPTLALDETKIRQVIMNFADNAIYYTPSGGTIKVELTEDKSNVYFKIIDNGLGIPKKDIPHLFTKFYRASNARKARPDGTGLGLFMAKKVIDAQGGHLLFESQENKGSTFGFCFDKKKHAAKKH